jgi:hypothetical protein
VNAACQGNLFSCHFGHACHRFMSVELELWPASCSGQLTPVKPPRYPFSRRLSGHQARSGRFGEGINPLLLAGIEPVFWRCPDKTQVTMHSTTTGCCKCKFVLGETTSRDRQVETVASECGGVRVMAVQAPRGVPEDKMFECRYRERNLILRGPNFYQM